LDPSIALPGEQYRRDRTRLEPRPTDGDVDAGRLEAERI